MKKIAAFILAAIAALTLTGCGHVDPTTTINPNDHSVYHYNRVHIINEEQNINRCYAIRLWSLDDSKGRIHVDIIGIGELYLYPDEAFLVEDKCPICDKEE